MSTTFGIALDERWFEGHFPGRPILPGVSQLALVLETLERHRGRPLRLSAIAFARMRLPVVPGDRLQFKADERPDGIVRIVLERDGSVVTNAEFRLDRAPEADPPPSVIADSPALDLPALDLPALDSLLPHRPPMRFVTTLLGESHDGLTCVARIPGDCPLVAQGTAPALAAIEAAAQATAVWEVARRRREGGAGTPRLGYLVGLRGVSMYRPHIPADVDFHATVRLEAASLPLAHYAMQVTLGRQTILRGSLSTFVTNETMGS